MAADTNVPESVRDSRWEADFEPNPHVPYQTTNTLRSGRRLLRQEIWIRQRRLGHGGFGVVWLEKAQSADQSSTRLRAVKELRVSQKDSRRRECIRELQALVKFSQQKFVGSFVEFYNWYESNDALFIAMEYCQHGDLRQFVKDHGAIIEVDVQKITDQVLQGLMFMHENNFAHRDLKPANILIQYRPPENEWKIKVGDMGLSKRIDIEATSTAVRGTPGFIAPERIPGIGPTPSATDPFPCDMWCLGEITFFLLTSKNTFDSPMQLQGYYNGTKSFPEERLHTAVISQQAIDFIKALMAAQPSQRLSAFQADYHSWMRDTEGTTGPQRNGLPDFSRSFASWSRDPTLDEMHEKLTDTSLDEFTTRDIIASNPPRHATDTLSVPSGSWDTSTVHLPSRSLEKPFPELSDLNQGTITLPLDRKNPRQQHADGIYERPLESRRAPSRIGDSLEPAHRRRRKPVPNVEESVPDRLVRSKSNPESLVNRPDRRPPSPTPYKSGYDSALRASHQRRFVDAYGEDEYGPRDNAGSSGAAKRVMDFFRRRGRARGGED